MQPNKDNQYPPLDNLIRKGWIMPNICHLCRKEAETAQHMFQQCDYTRQVIQMTIHQVRQISFTLDFQQGQYDAVMLEAGNKSQKRLQAALQFVVWRERCTRIFMEEYKNTMELQREVASEYYQWFSFS
jgi:zinc-binding in reverse transcriptase